MYNNSIQSIVKLIMNCAVRLPVALVMSIIRSTKPEDMAGNQFEEYMQYKVNELLSFHELIPLRRKNAPPDSPPDYFAVPDYTPDVYDNVKLRYNAIVLWCLWAYGKSEHVDDDNVVTFKHLSGLYPLDMPFQFLACFGNVEDPDTKAPVQLQAFDFACIDTTTYDVSIGLCRRVWELQKPIAPDKKDLAKNAEDQLYNRDRSNTDASGEALAKLRAESDSAIKHVAVLTSFPSDYPRNILDKLRAAGFHYVAYRPKRATPDWKSAKWRML